MVLYRIHNRFLDDPYLDLYDVDDGELDSLERMAGH